MPLSRLLADDIRALRGEAEKPAPGSERERIGKLAERAARSSLPVLIEGEPGSGAPALARAIHDCGERRERPFVRLHAGEAAGRRQSEARLPGPLKDAHGGTLFIDDVERLDADDQGELLAFLHRHDGARATRRHDVRIIAAGFDIAASVRAGRFREDLFYALQALPMSLRPLRAQPEAIADWTHRFVRRFAADEGKRIGGLSAEAGTLLARYEWPGNLRQLENAVYRAVILAEGPFLTPAEFPQIASHLQNRRIEFPPLPVMRIPIPQMPVSCEGAAGRDRYSLSLVDDAGDMFTLADLEAQAIRFALAHYRGRMSAISRHLGIGRSTLYRKLKELGLDDEAA